MNQKKLPCLLIVALVLMLVISVWAFPPLLSRVGNQHESINTEEKRVMDNDSNALIHKKLIKELTDSQLLNKSRENSERQMIATRTHDQQVLALNRFDGGTSPLDIRREFSSDESNPYIENVRQRYEFLAGGYEDIVR